MQMTLRQPKQNPLKLINPKQPYGIEFDANKSSNEHYLMSQ
jgi:hypothetical protein